MHGRGQTDQERISYLHNPLEWGRSEQSHGEPPIEGAIHFPNRTKFILKWHIKFVYLWTRRPHWKVYERLLSPCITHFKTKVAWLGCKKSSETSNTCCIPYVDVNTDICKIFWEITIVRNYLLWNGLTSGPDRLNVISGIDYVFHAGFWKISTVILDQFDKSRMSL